MEVTFHSRLKGNFVSVLVACKVQLYCFHAESFCKSIWFARAAPTASDIYYEEQQKKKLLLTSLLFSAESVKYKIKLKGETWKDSLAVLGSKKNAELADRIKEAVNISLLLFLFVVF